MRSDTYYIINKNIDGQYSCPGSSALLNDVPIPEQLHIDLYTFIQKHQDEIIHNSDERKNNIC